MSSKKKTLSNKELGKRLDRLAQTVSRCKGAIKKDDVWYSQCITCGKWCPCFGKDSCDGGHFVPRGCRITRWDESDIWPQCTACNRFRNGAYIEYSRWMQKHHPEEYEGLIALYEAHKKGCAPKLTVIEKRALYNSWLLKGRKLEEMTGLQLFPKSWDYIIMD